MSPVTGKNAVQLVKEFDSKYIVDLYQRELSVDVRKFFADVPLVRVYECLDTGYRYYEPSKIVGDPELYEKLQEIPWYYSTGKEEHLVALDAFSSNQHALEVGCGSGVFLNLLRDKGVTAVGLEFNSTAVRKASTKGLTVFQESIEEHVTKHHEFYDVVASFQVLEHVVNVQSFLNASLQALRLGGTLIVSVPNNDGAYHKFHEDPLNMPPHHMGLWGVNSLIALQQHFPLQLEKLVTDTSTPSEWIHKHAMQAVENNLRPKFGCLSPIICSLSQKFIKRGAESMSEFMPGQTVTAFYRKC
ncbi:MAG: class I SAM-dependent methyltransferase [Desulfuromonadales bacterium]